MSKTVAFLSNFSYSSNGAKFFDFQDIPLAIYEEAEDVEVKQIEASGAIAIAFNNLEFARKRSIAALLLNFSTTKPRTLPQGDIRGYYNLCCFSTESGIPCLAFNTEIGEDTSPGETPGARDVRSGIWSFATLLDFTSSARPDIAPVLTNFPQRLIATANNCVYFPSLSKTIGVPLIFASNNNPDNGDRTRLLKYPRINNSSSTITTANYYPVDLFPGYNKHVSIVSSQDSYYFSVGGSVSNQLFIKKLPYYNITSTAAASPYNVLSHDHSSGQLASSTMWVDNFNDLFITHGDIVFKIFAKLPLKNAWDDSAFNLINTEIYYLNRPFIIERAIVNIETGKHYALCSKNSTGYTTNTSLYMCSVTYSFDTPYNRATITELNPNPVSIVDTDNKHINIPTGGNYIIITSPDPSKAVFDLATNSWQPLNSVIDFQNSSLNNNPNIRVHSITQPTFRSSSNYLTLEAGSEYLVYRLNPAISN